MAIRLVANVVVHKGRAYLPTLAQVDIGMHMTTEPVYKVNLTQEELAEALERVIAAGNPVIPKPMTREEVKPFRDLLPKVTGLRSWRRLGKEAGSYSIEWTDKEVRLYLPGWDEKGRWASSSTLHLPADTDAGTLAKLIVEDARARPQLW